MTIHITHSKYYVSSEVPRRDFCIYNIHAVIHPHVIVFTALHAVAFRPSSANRFRSMQSLSEVRA